MARTYTLKKRAEQQDETRRRIVEAAVDLHSTVGPAATTFSMIAEKAGVQRHTLYSHFPDERSLYMACSGLVNERDPLPDAAAWRGIADRRERLATGFRAVYDWYERNASLDGLRPARRRTSRTHTGDRRAAVRPDDGGVARGPRREAEHEAARDAELRA